MNPLALAFAQYMAQQRGGMGTAPSSTFGFGQPATGAQTPAPQQTDLLPPIDQPMPGMPPIAQPSAPAPVNQANPFSQAASQALFGAQKAPDGTQMGVAEVGKQYVLHSLFKMFGL